MSPRRPPRLRRTTRVLLWLYVPTLLGLAGAILVSCWQSGLPQ